MPSSSSNSTPSPRLRSGRGRFAAVWNRTTTGGEPGEGPGETTASPSSSGGTAGAVVHSTSTAEDEGGDLSGGELFLFVDDALFVWRGPGGLATTPSTVGAGVSGVMGDSSSVGGGGWSQGKMWLFRGRM